MPELTLEDYIINLRDPDADVRRNAAWVLGRSRDIRIIEPLIAALADEDSAVRLRVAEALGNLRDERVIEPLITALSTETDTEIKAQLLASLGRQGAFQALDVIINALSDPSAIVRSAAAEALGTLPDDRSSIALVDMLMAEEDENALYQASRSLVQIGAAGTVNALTSKLSTPLNANHRMKIAEILGQLQDRTAADALRNLLADEDEAVVETARWALRQLGVG